MQWYIMDLHQWMDVNLNYYPWKSLLCIRNCQIKLANIIDILENTYTLKYVVLLVIFSIGCSTISNISDIEKKNELIVKLLVTH